MKSKTTCGRNSSEPSAESAHSRQLDLCFQPKIKSPLHLGQLEGFTHAASLFIIHPSLNVKALADQIESHLVQEKEITFGYSEASINGIIVKILANSSDRLHQSISLLADSIKKEHFTI